MGTYLIHHGIKGQKWGIRRFQNADGTLTDEGKRRKGRALDIAAKATYGLGKFNKTKKLKKEIKGLSDAELNKRIDRLEKEKKLRDLTEQDTRPGRTATKRVLSTVGSRVATTVLTGAAMYGIKVAIDKNFNMRDLADSMFRGGAKKK